MPSPRILPQEFYYIYVPLSSTSISAGAGGEQLLCHNRNQKKMSCTVKVNGNSAGLFSRRLPCFLACWPSSFCPLKDRAFFVPSSLVNEYAPSWGYGFILPCSSSSKKSSKTLHISLPRSPRFLLCHRLRKVDQTSSAPFCNPITESRMRSYKKKYREKLLKRLLLRTALLQSSNLIIVHLSWCAKILLF